AAGRPVPSSMTMRLPTWVFSPSHAAQQVAVLVPASTNSASSAASSGLSPNEKVSRPRQSSDVIHALHHERRRRTSSPWSGHAWLRRARGRRKLEHRHIPRGGPCHEDRAIHVG